MAALVVVVIGNNGHRHWSLIIAVGIEGISRFLLIPPVPPISVVATFVTYGLAIMRVGAASEHLPGQRAKEIGSRERSSAS